MNQLFSLKINFHLISGALGASGNSNACGLCRDEKRRQSTSGCGWPPIPAFVSGDSFHEYYFHGKKQYISAGVKLIFNYF